MNGFSKDSFDETTALKIANSELAKGKAVAEQLLGHILLEIGEPVVVSKEDIKKGFPPDMEISIVDDDDVFRFEVTKSVQ